MSEKNTETASSRANASHDTTGAQTKHLNDVILLHCLFAVFNDFVSITIWGACLFGWDPVRCVYPCFLFYMSCTHARNQLKMLSKIDAEISLEFQQGRANGGVGRDQRCRRSGGLVAERRIGEVARIEGHRRAKRRIGVVWILTGPENP